MASQQTTATVGDAVLTTSQTGSFSANGVIVGWNDDNDSATVLALLEKAKLEILREFAGN